MVERVRGDAGVARLCPVGHETEQVAFEVNRRQSVRKADGDAGEEAASARKGAGEVRESAGKLIVWQEAIGNAGATRR